MIPPLRDFLHKNKEKFIINNFVNESDFVPWMSIYTIYIYFFLCKIIESVIFPNEREKFDEISFPDELSDEQKKKILTKYDYLPQPINKDVVNGMYNEFRNKLFHFMKPKYKQENKTLNIDPVENDLNYKKVLEQIWNICEIYKDKIDQNLKKNNIYYDIHTTLPGNIYALKKENPIKIIKAVDLLFLPFFLLIYI